MASISSTAADGLQRSPVDVDYYVAMGGGAYAELSTRRATQRGNLALVFAELSDKFTDFVDALAEVGEDANFSTDADLLRSYENWLRTGSKRSARQLRRAGIEPSVSNVSRSSH